MKRKKCKECKEIKPLTRHHVYTRKHYPRSNTIFRLCRSCHDNLNRLIPQQKMPKFMYRYILNKFLKGGKNEEGDISTGDATL